MSEFGPSPEEQAEKEAQGVALATEISDLRRKATSEADFESILPKLRELRDLYGIGSTETRLSGELAEQIEAAKEILGADVFGPDAVREAYGTDIDLTEIPAINFSIEELEKAKEMGQMLILRAGQRTDGKPLTMQGIGELLEDKVKGDGKVYYDTDWYKEEGFFTNEPIETRWALVSKELVPDSVSKNYLEQTRMLIDQLTQAFGGAEKLPPEYLDAIDEFGSAYDEIAGLIDFDWQKAAEKLEALKINQMLRQTPAEALYDLILRYQNIGERPLPDRYTWTNRRSSDGHLVYVGCFRSDGVNVDGGRPGRRYDYLGVSFSRSR